jgi:hypothetical protein
MSEENQPTRKLKLDIAELAFNMEDASDQNSYFLDLESGRILLLTDEIKRQLDELLEEELDDAPPDSETFLESALEHSDLLDWEKEDVREAYAVENGLGDRYLEVPRADSSEAFRDMQEFVDTVHSQSLKNRLSRALQGQRPFRRFKDALSDSPQDEELWYRFQTDRLQQRAREWLAENGIEPLPAT